MKRTISIIILCLIIASAFSQGTIPVKGYFKFNFVFESGFWVYRDTTNNDIDSISLTNCIHNYVSPNPVCPDYQEYYLMEFYSHTHDYSYNEYIVTSFWKRNGGGQYGELGQPVMHIGQFAQYPQVGNGFNGYEIIAMLDNLEVCGVMYYDVVVSRIYEDQQYQYEFGYDTDLYFAPGVGIIREEFIDDLGNNHVWDLVHYENNNVTGINDGPTGDQNASVHPNPAHERIMISCRGMEGVGIYDIRGRPTVISERKCDECVIDIEGMPVGMYLIRITTEQGIETKRIVIE